MTEKIFTINDVAVVCERGAPAYTPYGYIVGEDGKIYALTSQSYHGVVLAVLYPEVAAEKGYAPPAGAHDEVDVFKYQRFELDHSDGLPIIRVAISRMTESINVSKGRIAATDEQIDALQRIFRTLGRRANDTLTGEDDDLSVGEFIENLRQERVRAAIPDDDPEKYKLVPPEGWPGLGVGDE
jgi:hypothetical protein